MVGKTVLGAGRSKWSKVLALGAVAGVLALSRTASAVVAFAPVGSTFDNGEGNDGLFFTPKVNLVVRSLGYFDCGFVTSKPVAIYDVATGTILAQLTITGSSDEQLYAGFRYRDLQAPLELESGRQYALVALNPFVPNNTDRGIWATTTLGTDSAITFNGYKYDYNGTLDLPTSNYATAIAVINMQYDEAPSLVASVIPEPGVAGLLPVVTGVALKRSRRLA